MELSSRPSRYCILSFDVLLLSLKLIMSSSFVLNLFEMLSRCPIGYTELIQRVFLCHCSLRYLNAP
jgi:hypothetical protein